MLERWLPYTVTILDRFHYNIEVWVSQLVQKQVMEDLSIDPSQATL